MASLCKRDNKIQLWSMENDRLEEIESPMVEHGTVISAIAASKDGKWIVSGNDDGVVVIWNTTTLPIQKVGELKAVKGDGRRITALDISPDSSRIAIGSENGMMVIWCIERKERILGPLQHQTMSPVSSIKFSPVGGRIASSHLDHGRGDCSIQLWHSRTGARLESIGNPHSTYSLAWSVDGHRLFAGGSAGSIKCFNVLTRTLVEWRAPSIRDLITSLRVSNSGQILVSMSSGRVNAIDIWNIWSIPPSPCKPLRSRNEVLMTSISPDDAHLISVGRDNDVTLWSLSTLIHKSYLSHVSIPDLYEFINLILPFKPLSLSVADADPVSPTESRVGCDFTVRTSDTVNVC